MDSPGSSSLYWDNYLEIEIGGVSGGNIGTNNCKVFMYNNIGNGGLTLMDFTSPATSGINVIYEKDVLQTLFSVGRDSNTSVLEVKEGGVSAKK